MKIIYQEQEKGGEKQHPFNYMPDDVVFRYPWFMGDDEPPLRILYPLVYNEKRKETVDPLTIYIGRTRRNKPFGYNPRYVLNPLLLIVGTPGAGKSATIKTMIYNFLRNEYFLEEGYRLPPIIVVDPEGEYGVLKQFLPSSDVLHLMLGRRDYINIFDRPSRFLNPFSWYMRILSVVQKFLYLTPSQASQAYRVLKTTILDLARSKGFTNDPATWFRDDITLEEIYHSMEKQLSTLEGAKKLSPADRRTLQGLSTLYTRLDPWMIPPNDAFSKKSTINLTKMLNYKLVILDARGLSKDLFGLFSYWIAYWTYGLMLEKGPLPSFGVRMVLVIDEAWALLRRTESKEEENPLEALARRGRKYGIMIVVATQTPEDVDKKMFSLFGTLVAGLIPSDEMVKKIVESRGMPQRLIQEIKTLRQGELVWSINWRTRDFEMSGVPIIVFTEYPIRDVVQIR